MKNNHHKNWAGNYHYKAKSLYQPDKIEQIQELVKKSDKIKALGSRHCFNDIADTSAVQISTQNLNQIVAIDEKAMTVTIESGLQYGQFCPELNKKGFALHNLASLPHISVVGACATATHGSGVKNGNLATVVSAVEFVSGTGELVTLTRQKDGEKFNGAIVNLGGLGIITKITLDIEKSFSVRQDCFQNLSFEQLRENFDEIMSNGYSVSLFTNWNGFINQVWIKRRVGDDLKELSTEFFRAKSATENLHPITGISAENCTEQMGIAGEWCERLPHFKMGFTPSSGEELQSEYFVPKENAVETIFALEKLSSLISPHLLVSEIRTIAADNLWLSPCYQTDCVAFHFTWKQDIEAVEKLLLIIEAELAPYKARPHWGKLFATSPKVLHSLYPKLPDFIELLKEFDPQGKFRNDYLERNIFGN